jgi:hypothetical protein
MCSCPDKVALGTALPSTCLQCSPTLVALWPDLMDMIGQGHLQEPIMDAPFQLCFMGGSTLSAACCMIAENSSHSVHEATMADGSKARGQGDHGTYAGQHHHVTRITDHYVHVLLCPEG